ncbi:3-hydroxyacyl-CoA dehydrogenase [Pseudomonas sp. zfem005]|uniref:3-hydroxyacyl-CoA dehydrogenase n=1 Tax=Pseudomonas sp. zfem005 TaxID=3078200 RepID=UPI00292901E3|nr:3-hydroxyacyl-CoA dehydrogenase [Pseudomonas sp. zfem005]MDU9416484.1 3-hydroxyacyl-CoA dehydrogenase [Pseudomonas sp. zfem005]
MNGSEITHLGVVGCGAMGQGIAQLAACAGLQVRLHDVRPEAAAQARERILAELEKQRDKGRVSDAQLEQARVGLLAVEGLQGLAGCQLVVEAIVEELPAKQALFRQLEALLGGVAILASNTSSLSITAIAAACEAPGRVAGLHFFNPVPRMRLVEVIPGLATDEHVVERLLALVRRLGHQPVRAQDSPGFLVNHAGRAYGTEALRILAEGVAAPAEVDALLRDGTGFPMGPFELMDLVGLDVSVPVMESIYRQYYEEPRYRPHPLLRQRLAAGHLGRKSGRGFHRYPPPDAVEQPPIVALDGPRMPVWLGLDEGFDAALLRPWLEGLGAVLEEGERPSTEALCLLAPLGLDATEAALHLELDPTRVVAFDALAERASHRCLMSTPVTRPDCLEAARALFAADGGKVTVIRDSAGFVVQRTLAGIVNLACDIAQQGIATPADIDLALHLGLGYPLGPLAWGDHLGAARVLSILQRLHALSGDPRYRPSPWLRRRARLGLSLLHVDAPFQGER